jgi:hypothetical protein
VDILNFRCTRETQVGETRIGAGPYTLPKVNPAINEGRTVSASRAGAVESRANDSAQRASEPARAGKRRARAVRPRGSGGTYAPAALSTPSLGLPQQSAGPYIPPPINNPSAQINQLNHSFPLNGGLGLNPTGRDAYIRYNLTR